MEQDVYSLCFMCSVRCPIKVGLKDGQVNWIQGNPHVGGMGTSLCPRGAAGVALLNDNERLQHPLIRVGERGAGNWRKASWDEALDYVGDKLKKIIKEHGPQSLVLGERGNLSTHVSKTFLKAIGCPNHFSHDAVCKGSANTAFRSMFGYTDAQANVDLKNARQIIMYGRNLFEAIEVKPARALMEALENGAKLTYLDPRVSVTATKSHRYWMIRPGTDIALNYAMIHVIFKEKLYDAEFVDRWVHGLSELREFVEPYTPEWAEKESGIPAEQIKDAIREISKDKPNIVFHHGYRCAHHTNEIHMRRSILILNTLMGSIESKGGLFFKKGAGAVGGKPARKLTEQTFPKHEMPIRFDHVGTPRFPLPDPVHGVGQMLPLTILSDDPYPIKALISNRFDPIASIPDSNQTIKALNKLELIVSIDINFGNTVWYSDVILPESIFLERLDCVQQANGLKPMMFLRQQAVNPCHDTREAAMIIKQIGERIGIGEYFPYNNMEELIDWQLEGTGFSRKDFEAKGFVSYGKDQIFWDRKNGLKFKTPSGKIEFKSSLMEDAGFESFPAYEPVLSPPENQFRLLTGRVAIHTHVSTQNNLYLNELFPENVLWINKEKAEKLGIKDGDLVHISSKIGDDKIKAYVSDLIHPEAVFMIHGFGHLAKKATRAYNKGISDAKLQENISDMVGGSPALHHTFVSVTPVVSVDSEQ